MVKYTKFAISLPNELVEVLEGYACAAGDSTQGVFGYVRVLLVLLPLLIFLRKVFPIRLQLQMILISTIFLTSTLLKMVKKSF